VASRRAAALKAAVALLPVLVALHAPGQAAAQQPHLGYNESGSLTEFPTAATVGNLTASGIGPGAVVRFGVSWRSVLGNGWGPTDEIYEALRARGLRALPIVIDAPKYANTSCTAPPCPPTPPHYGGWANFVAAAASRYEESVAIEVWNEPNKRGNWNTLIGPDPAHYAAVFRVAADAIHAAEPSLPVLVGGMAPVAKDVLLGDLTTRTFLTRFYNAGGGASLLPADGLSLHVYPNRNQLTPEALLSPYSGLSTYMRDVRQVRDARDPAGSARGLWVTEVGWSMTGDRPVTEAKQAQGLVSALGVLRAMPDVRSILVHRLVDPARADVRRVVELGFGVVRRNLAPKLAYCGLAAELGRPTPAGCG
jgi:hypothetical protein